MMYRVILSYEEWNYSDWLAYDNYGSTLAISTDVRQLSFFFFLKKSFQQMEYSLNIHDYPSQCFFVIRKK